MTTVLGALALGATSLLAPMLGAAPGSGALALKKMGSELFWEGERIESAHVADPSLCGRPDACYAYRLDVPESAPGARLRVALTAILPEPGAVRPWADSLVKSPEMLFVLQLFEPGSDPATDSTPHQKENGNGLHGYSVEILVGGNDANGDPMPAPPSGTWIVRAVPQSVMDMSFRMRAKLEMPAPDPEGLLYPDLRLNPPFEITFSSVPASFDPGVTADHAGPRASCMAEEVEESARVFGAVPQLCLRFSMGAENAGDGAFEIGWIRPPSSTDTTAQLVGVEQRPRLQRVCDYRGLECEFLPDRQITTTFHAFHAHDHWLDGWTIRLWRVADDSWTPGHREPPLEPLNVTRKIGFNPGPELLADWDRFYQTPQDVAPAPDNSGCFDYTYGGPCGSILLQGGWADLYEWNRGGNYVEFPQAGPLTPQPGFYLLRGAVDPDDEIVESDETNNLAYALFHVGDEGVVDLLERGYGADPWDPKRDVSEVAP